MKAVNVENLKRIKRALQKKKLKRIDSYRMQVGRCDFYNNDQQGYDHQGVTQDLIKDNNG
jgi:hypothetical protein